MRDANESALHQYEMNEQKKDRRDEAVQQQTQDNYELAFEYLAKTNRTGSSFQLEPGYNCWGAINEISLSAFADIGAAIVAGDDCEVGRLITSAVKKELMKQAKAEAEDQIDFRDKYDK